MLVACGVDYVRMDVGMFRRSMMMGVGVNGNVTSEQAYEHGDASEQQDARSRDIESTLPCRGHGQSAKMSEQRRS